MLVSIWSSC